MSVSEQTTSIPRPKALPRVNWRALGTIVFVGAICLIPVLLYAPFFTEPLARDEGYFAAASQGLLHGQVPYRDFFDNKPPLIYGWYALSFLLFGETLWAPRVLVSLLVSCAALCVYVTGRLIYGHHGGVVAAIAFSLSVGITKFEINANTEFFMLLPMAANMMTFTLARQTGKGWWYIAAGVTGGLAILTKTIYVIPMAFLFAYAVWADRPEGRWPTVFKPAAWKRPVLMIIGSLAAFVVVSAPIALAGGFPDMMEALTYYSLIYSEGSTIYWRFFAMGTSPIFLALVGGPWPVLAVGGAILLLRDKAKARQGIVLLGWLLSGLFSIYIVGRFYYHYYAVLLPAMALLIPPAVSWLARVKVRSPLAIGLVLAAFPLAAAPALSLQVYLEPTPADRHSAKYGIAKEDDWEYQSLALGQWLKDHTREGDYIWDFGFENQIYFYSGRTSPIRFYFDHAFGLDKKYEDEALRELKQTPPVYVVDSAIYEGDTHQDNYYSVPIHDWVTQNYDYVGKIEFADVWHLKGSS